MKKLFVLGAMVCALGMMTACKSGNGYSITGTAQGHDGEKVYVYNTEADVIIDSTTIVDGQFFFSGHTDTAMLVWVEIYTDDDFFGVNLLLQPNSDITIDANSTTLKGDRPSEQLNQFTSQLDSLRAARQQMGLLSVQMQSDSLYAIYESYAQQMKDYVDSVGWTLYEANADNKVGAQILYIIADVLPEGINLYREEPTPAIQRLLSIYASASPAVKSNKDLERSIRLITARTQMKAGTAFRDFEAIDYVSGKHTTLGAVINEHVAVIDFWASWCGPCRREIEQTLMPLYKKYADRGLVVVGIDVWDEVEKHDIAVKEMGIAYPQLIDTDKNNSTLLYGLQMIPQIFLIDRDGTILGNYRGDELVKAVEKALGIKE